MHAKVLDIILLSDKAVAICGLGAKAYAAAVDFFFNIFNHLINTQELEPWIL